jgi:hypothetical protein
LAGSVVEALLLWKLDQDDLLKPGRTAASAKTRKLKHAADPLNDWLFHELITVATDHGHLSGDTLTAVKLGQNFRNLIHPGRAARLSEACNRGTAYSTVGAMERVITEFS